MDDVYTFSDDVVILTEEEFNSGLYFEEDTYALDGIETFALSPIESSTGLKGILLDVLGPYDNIITQYRYQAYSSSNYAYVHETTPDYPWIASSLLFIVLVYSVFSLLRRAIWMR